ncbi:MAG: polysaccharide deacetylase family protein [Nitrospirales bacterium]|nr:MAG: polysaccharide deacetylase family protein [Nitrospirales bacterium]
MIEKILGTCIRNIPSTEKVLYLTFDDGPHEDCTPKVLDLLSLHHVPATFFVVAEALQRNLSVGRSIVAHGHNVGNHSLDHKYHHFFLNDRYLMKWVGHARDVIEQSLQVQTIGFRSPFGIRTPHLGMALRKLHYPLVHWNQRFFDTQRGLPRTAIVNSVSRFRSGDILLLHDTHSKYHQSFFEGLGLLLVNAKKAGFIFQAIPNNLIPST